MAEPAKSSGGEKGEKATPEPVQLTEALLIQEAPFRFGVEPYVAAGALSGQMRGDTMSVDRAQKLIDDFLKQEHSMEVAE